VEKDGYLSGRKESRDYGARLRKKKGRKRENINGGGGGGPHKSYGVGRKKLADVVIKRGKSKTPRQGSNL